MNPGLQEFIRDLSTFFADLTDLCNRRTIADAFAGQWRSIRRDDNRKLPLLFTVGFHLAVLLISIAAPFLKLSKPPRIPEVYTVNLYTAPEEAAAPPQAPRVVKVTTPPPKKAVAPKPEIKKTVAPPTAKKEVSLSPIRQRLEREIKEKEARRRREELKDRQLEQVKMELLKDQAEKAAEQAEQALLDAKKDAAAKIAELYRSSDHSGKGDSMSTRAVDGAATGKGGPAQQEALDRYRARLFEHISPYWQLPELQEWDEDLRAVIVMQVNRDGTVTNTYFEKRSKDARFDQYAQKAIENAQPLPPFPIDFQEKSEEIAVTFSPGGLL